MGSNQNTFFLSVIDGFQGELIEDMSVALTTVTSCFVARVQLEISRHLVGKANRAWPQHHGLRSFRARDAVCSLTSAALQQILRPEQCCASLRLGGDPETRAASVALLPSSSSSRARAHGAPS